MMMMNDFTATAITTIDINVSLEGDSLSAFPACLNRTLVSDIAVFVLKRDVKLQLTHSLGRTQARHVSDA